MNVKQLLLEYIDNKIDAMNTLRVLTNMFNPKDAVNILAVVNQITRVEQGDLTKEAFKELLGFE